MAAKRKSHVPVLRYFGCRCVLVVLVCTLLIWNLALWRAYTDTAEWKQGRMLLPGISWSAHLRGPPGLASMLYTSTSPSGQWASTAASQQVLPQQQQPSLAQHLLASADKSGKGLWKLLDLASTQPSAIVAAQSLLAVAVANNTNLSVIQVGGCDGAWEMTNDPVQALLPNERVHALVFEPVPGLWKELAGRLSSLPHAAERLQAINAAICLQEQPYVPFFVVSERFAKEHPESEHWARRELGSFDRKHLLNHRIPPEYMETIQVRCLTAEGILMMRNSTIGSSPQNIDALIVDAEGLDGELVEHFLMLRSFRPSLIILEHKHLSKPARKHIKHRLQHAGYHAWRDKDQLVAVRVSESSLWKSQDELPDKDRHHGHGRQHVEDRREEDRHHRHGWRDGEGAHPDHKRWHNDHHKRSDQKSHQRHKPRHEGNKRRS